MRRSRASAALVAAGLLAGACAGAPAAAAAEARARPVVLVAVPDLRWSDLAAMPHLRELEARGAVGELSVRSQGESTRCGDALLQLSAGTRVPSGVVGCSLDAARLAELRRRYRHSSYDVRVGLLGARLATVRTAATDSAAAVVLSTAAGPPPIVPLHPALGQAEVVVSVDDGLYGATDRARAAASVDARLASVLVQVDAATTVIVAGVSDAPRGGPHLHPIVVAGPDWPHRELTSPTTGRAPYVQLFDLSATLLHLLGQPVPSSMSGRAIRAGGEPVAPTSTYADADRHATRAHTFGHPTFSALCGVLLGCLLLLLLMPSLARWPLRLLLAAPLATWLVQLVPWWRWPVAAFVGIVAGVAVLVAAVQWLASTRSTRAALLVGPALAVVVLVVDQLIGAPLQLSAPFGDNPLVAGRFHGMGNIDFAVTMASLLLCTAVVAASLPRRRAVAVVAAVGVAAVVVDGAPWLGDDLGGVVALVPAFAVLAAAVAGVRVTTRRAVAVGAAAVGLAIALGLVDYARPAARQTHAGRFVGQVLHGGAGTVLHRKADAVAGSLATPLVTALVVAVVAAAVLAARRGALPATPAGVRPAMASIAVLAVVGSLLNDSGVFVAAAAVLAFAPAVTLAALGDTRRL